MQYKTYFHLLAGMAMLELGNLASSLAPFNVSTVSIGLNANSQEAGLVVTLELFLQQSAHYILVLYLTKEGHWV